MGKMAKQLPLSWQQIYVKKQERALDNLATEQAIMG
jgi:hypothetical protein